jgi:formate/nitrite transporter FocA (FNT family)
MKTDTVPCPPARGFVRILLLFARWPIIIGAVSGGLSVFLGPYVLLAAAVSALIAMYAVLEMYHPIPDWTWAMGTAVVVLTSSCSIAAGVATRAIFVHDGTSMWLELVMFNVIGAIVVSTIGASIVAGERLTKWLNRS